MTETTKSLTKRANKLYQIDVAKMSKTTNIFNLAQLQMLHEATPPEHIHHFPDNAGAMAGLPFVAGGYMKHKLDILTGGAWSFEIKEKGIVEKAGQIWVLGRLTLYKPDSMEPMIFKEQFGRVKIKYRRGPNGKPTDDMLDLGNDMKAAATDALKKCASELGIARDIYAANEFLELEIVDASEVEDLPQDKNTADNTPTRPKVNDAFKQHVSELLVELYPKMYDRTSFISKLTKKMSVDKFTEYDWIFVETELQAQKLAELQPDIEAQS